MPGVKKEGARRETRYFPPELHHFGIQFISSHLLLQRKKERAKEREEAKKETFNKRMRHKILVTQQTMGMFYPFPGSLAIYLLSSKGMAFGPLGTQIDEEQALHKIQREELFGKQGAEKVAELESMLSTIYNRACDLKQPIVWPSMPLKLG